MSASPRPERKLLLALLLGCALFRLALTAWASRFVLVDDAYITLRTARVFLESGELVFNPGERVLGITTPSWGLISAAFLSLFGKLTPAVLVVFGVACWSAVSWLVSSRLPRRSRFAALTLLSLWPTFTDNQMLGMETPFFCLLLVLAERATHRAKLTQAAAWLSAALVTRPEAVLFAPCLFAARAHRVGVHSALRELFAPKTLYALCALPLVWFSYAFAIYGSIVPHSAVAKTGWKAEHYVRSAGDVLSQLTLRLSPFAPAEHLPGALPLLGALAAAGLFALTLLLALRKRELWNSPWVLFLALYLGFYAAGRGATEASWYSIPPTLAVFAALGRTLPRFLRMRRPAVRIAAILLLAGASAFSGLRRGDLLNCYEEGYGEASRALVQARGDSPTRVLIGEIGVYGWSCDFPIVDVAALISPEVLSLRANQPSFIGLVQATGVTHFVVSESSVEQNRYPTLTGLWASEAEAEFFEHSCQRIFTHAGKATYAVSTVSATSTVSAETADAR